MSVVGEIQAGFSIARYIAKIALYAGLVVAFWFVTNLGIDFLVTLLSTLVSPDFGETPVPILEMMRYVGVFDALSTVIGAHLAVATFSLTIFSVRYFFG